MQTFAFVNKYAYHQSQQFAYPVIKKNLEIRTFKVVQITANITVYCNRIF